MIGTQSRYEASRPVLEALKQQVAREQWSEAWPGCLVLGVDESRDPVTLLETILAIRTRNRGAALDALARMERAA